MNRTTAMMILQNGVPVLKEFTAQAQALQERVDGRTAAGDLCTTALTDPVGVAGLRLAPSEVSELAAAGSASRGAHESHV